MNPTPEFHPHQILSLDHENSCLYGEVIQVVTKRQICWLRPLALLTRLESDGRDRSITGRMPEIWIGSDPVKLYDLRQGADLLCPYTLFRVALDTEVVPILAELDAAKPPLNDSNHSSGEAMHLARYQLQAFIRRVAQAHPEAFKAT